MTFDEWYEEHENAIEHSGSVTRRLLFKKCWEKATEEAHPQDKVGEVKLIFHCEDPDHDMPPFGNHCLVCGLEIRDDTSK